MSLVYPERLEELSCRDKRHRYHRVGVASLLEGPSPYVERRGEQLNFSNRAWGFVDPRQGPLPDDTNRMPPLVVDYDTDDTAATLGNYSQLRASFQDRVLDQHRSQV